MRLHTAFSLTLLSIALLFNLTACGSTTAEAGTKQESKIAQPRVIENISYVDNDTSAAHTLDLYFPPGEHKKVPLLVWIHGGAWKEGDKQPSPMMPLLVRGFAVAGINYRFAPEHKFPAQIYDCKAAIRWLRKHADEYGIDKDRIGVFGISAGGHLAALLGATNGVKELEGDIGTSGASSNVQAVVAWCGVGNLATLHAQAGKEDQLDYDSDNAPVSMFLGGTAKNKPEAAKAASPVTYLKPGLKVPCLIMHAVNDPVVPFAQSQELYDAWKKTGAPATLESVKSDQHIFISVPTMMSVIDFFQKTLADK
ncbi:MAG: alpha/beta hydrolase, partial [Candidatus Obscuribacterales bacterium]|nr:alpha/beta hydrolase [Candidatus Obscuribacterales bacterium]